MQLAHVPRELVEHQRQGEREVLEPGRPAYPARIAPLPQLRGGLLDHLPVGPVDVDPASVVLVGHVLLPVVALLVGARGKRPVQRRSVPARTVA